MEKKVALITGASKGIGKAIAKTLAKDGMSIVLNYNRDESEASMAADEIRKLGVEVFPIKADVSKFEECASMMESVKQKFGRLDVLVNNAGATADKSLFNMSKEQWDMIIGINLTGVFNVTKNALSLMKEGGRIVNISSIAGLNGNAGQTNYAASKAGIVGFTKSLAKELGKRGITVNAIAPGFIDTDMTKQIPFIKRKMITMMIPMGRGGKPEEVADAVAYLASDRSSYITGTVLRVDGGLNF